MQPEYYRNKILLLSVFSTLFFIFMSIVPCSDAHILIIASNSTPQIDNELESTANVLTSKGYNVLLLTSANDTTQNIIEGMYNADAVIYGGHGGYMTGNYNGNGGPATPPFAIVGSNNFIWGVGGEMREGFNGKLFKAPFKPGAPVTVVHACFSTGWVDNNQVSNPIETVYDFSQMFTAAGANYYASGYSGNYQGIAIVDIVDEFLNGATNFGDANKMNTGKTITESTIYNNETIWRNNNGYNVFIGNWNATFPKPNQTSPYNNAAAEAWYDKTFNGNNYTNLTVSSTNPTNESTGVSLTTPVTITFNQNILADYNLAKIYIKNLTTGKIVSLASETISGTNLIIKQTYSRLYNDIYQIYIPSGAVKNIKGKIMNKTYTFQFKTI
ncbi:MAG: Ig-like domain-containing protein [Methanobacterium sp.]|jgi:hypothetical protein